MWMHIGEAHLASLSLPDGYPLPVCIVFQPLFAPLSSFTPLTSTVYTSTPWSVSASHILSMQR